MQPDTYLTLSFGEDFRMSADLSVVQPDEPAETLVGTAPSMSQWVETALTVMFTAAAVLFVSFIAVVTGLV